MDFNAAAVRFGKPGKLWIANVDAAEPDSYDDAWPAGWVPLGYTDEGSAFNYEISTDNVEVAEELDVLARVTTGRDASVEFALAELTKKNLSIAFNGGIIVGDGADWEFEPPDLGDEQRVMIGWDAAKTVAKNDLRIIFRQCLQGGSLGIENRKGATKATISANFQLEKPTSGKKLLRITGAGSLNPTP
ncbi:MAG: hypothetical protein ABWX96_13530 [Propionibacteriaceae bacterium]